MESATATTIRGERVSLPEISRGNRELCQHLGKFAAFGIGDDNLARKIIEFSRQPYFVFDFFADRAYWLYSGFYRCPAAPSLHALWVRAEVVRFQIVTVGDAEFEFGLARI